MGAGVGAATDLKLVGGCGCSERVRLGIPPEVQTRDGDARQRDEVMMTTNGERQTTTATASLTTAGVMTSMDADLNTYPILILPASNTFHFCHHPQPHHSQPYHAQSIIYHPSFIINGNFGYQAYSITISIFSIFNRLPSPLRPPLNSVK